MMVGAVRTGSYTFASSWFLTRDEDGTFHDATDEQPEGSERDLIVDFEFSAEEPASFDCPGSAAVCEITRVQASFDGEYVEVPQEFIEEVMDQDLTEQAWEHVPGQEG